MKYIHSLSVIILSVFLIPACDDFLDKKPTNYTAANEAVNTLKDAEVAMNGIMRSMTSAYYYGRNFLLYGDAKGGDMTIASQGLNNQGLFLFSHSANTGNFSSYWDTGYFCIMQVNNLLQQIEEMEDEGVAGLPFIKGQALTLRGLMYFDLVRLYGLPYNYNKNAYGVPDVLTLLEYNAKPTRATVEGNYTRILKDLKDGEELLSADKSTKNGFIGYYANIALQARVKLFMDDFDGAFTASKEVIDNGPYTLYEPEEWVSSWTKQFGPESIFEIGIYSNEGDLKTNSLIYYLMRRSHVSSASGNFMASDSFLERLNEDGTDVRWGVMARDQTSTSRLACCYKYGGDISLSGDGKETFTAVNIKVVRLSEMYLIAAEAALNKTGSNPALAAEYLNEVRRRSPALPAATAATITDDMILDERSKELYSEGHRFFDMMRKNKKIKFHDGFYNAVAPTENQRPNEIDRTFYKIVLPISQTEINSNPAIGKQQNTGY